MSSKASSNYVPVKTEFSALCARLGVSQSDIAEIVPCRLDTVKKWQSGKMQVRPEVLGQLHNMDAAIRSAASLVKEIAEDLIDRNGVLHLNAPSSFDRCFNLEIAPNVLEVFIRAYYAEISLQLLGHYHIVVDVCDTPFNTERDDLYGPINILLDEFDPEYYWSRINPARSSPWDDQVARRLSSEVWLQLKNKIENFDAAEFTRVDILQVLYPRSSDQEFEDKIGIDLEWEGSDGMPYLIDLTFPLEEQQIDADLVGVEMVERTSLNGGHQVVHPKWNSDMEDRQHAAEMLSKDILDLLSARFSTVSALVDAVKSHEAFEGDL